MADAGKRHMRTVREMQVFIPGSPLPVVRGGVFGVLVYTTTLRLQ